MIGRWWGLHNVEDIGIGVKLGNTDGIIRLAQLMGGKALFIVWGKEEQGIYKKDKPSLTPNPEGRLHFVFVLLAETGQGEGTELF